MRFATAAIHVGQAPDPTTGATIPPIHITSTFTQESPGKHKGYEYARTNNPTRQNLELALAAVEGGRGALAFASGLAACEAIVAAWLRPGDVIVAYRDLYAGIHRLFERVFQPWGLVTRYCEDVDPEALAGMIDARTRMVWIETPTNPLLRVLDIRRLAEAIASSAARQGPPDGRVLLVVDNTFATPALQRPLELGADVVVHSTTKYIGGHSDQVGGALVTNHEDVLDRVRFHQNAAGAVPGPFECYLAHRGLKTLEVRMQRHGENALRVAQWAEKQAGFQRVIYPGLPSHPEHEIARRQMAGFGGVVSVELAGGPEAARRFLAELKLFACAESLGGVESLASQPASMTHAYLPPDLRSTMGVSDALVRLSVGLEDVNDLIEDLDQALRKAQG